MTETIKAVIFDIDDTLFDRAKAQRRIFDFFKRKYADLFESVDDHMLATAFYEADRLAAEFFFADGKKESLREGRFDLFLAMLGLDKSYAAEMTELYLKEYTNSHSEVEGAKAMIEKLSEKYKLGIITNGLAETQYQKLDALNIKDMFQSIIISEEVGIQKPESKIFWEATKALSCNNNECLYVGNSYAGDVMGAGEAGLKACWFNPSRTHPLQMDIKPDFEIARLDELLTFL
jgi:putative hydrolase of the HAD superfamily